MKKQLFFAFALFISASMLSSCINSTVTSVSSDESVDTSAYSEACSFSAADESADFSESQSKEELSSSGESVNDESVNNESQEEPSTEVSVSLPVYNAEIIQREYHIPERYFSEGIKNIVRRARQITDIHWVPKQDITGFDGKTVFEKGHEYTGIPYGQPVYSGKWLYYDVPVSRFRESLDEENGVIYTKAARYEEDSPYYSLDCSAFVSYAWESKIRMVAAYIASVSQCHGTETDNIQVGDALIMNTISKHAVLVTGVKEDENNHIVWIEISELTPPLAKVTCYGEEELFSMDDFKELYMDFGFKIYRNAKHRDSTGYEHTCACPLEDDRCDECDAVTCYGTLEAESTSCGISVNCGYSSPDTVKFKYIVTSKQHGALKCRTCDNVETPSLSVPNGYDSVKISIPPSTIITPSRITCDSQSRKWGFVHWRSKDGWVLLDECSYLGGIIDEPNGVYIDAYTDTAMSYAIINITNEELFDDCIVNIYAVQPNGAEEAIGRIAVKLRDK